VIEIEPVEQGIVQLLLPAREACIPLPGPAIPFVNEVLPGKKTATFFQLDRRAQVMIDIQLASQLPQKSSVLFLRLFFQFSNETCSCAVVTGEQATPWMCATPKIVACLGVNYRQIGVSRGSLLVVIRNAVFGDVTALDATGLATRKNNVPIPVWVGGEQKYHVGLLRVVYELKLAPLFQLAHGILPHFIGARLILEERGLRRQHSR